MTAFEATRAWAEAQDAADPLRDFRADFHIPQHEGHDTLYFCGNSLGLQPKEFAPRSKRSWRTGRSLRSRPIFVDVRHGCTTTSTYVTRWPTWWVRNRMKSWR